MLYKSSTTVEILDRITPNDVAFGENYTERTKKINSFFRTKYSQVRSENEDANYFKSTLFNSFDYKEMDVVQSVKEDFNANSQTYFELNKVLGMSLIHI